MIFFSVKAVNLIWFKYKEIIREIYECTRES